MDFCVVLISCCEPLVPRIHNRMNQSSMEAQTQMNDMHEVSLPIVAHTLTHTRMHNNQYSPLSYTHLTMKWLR